MLPLRLEIQGLLSYKTLQVVDFTRLTRYPLFGIFGKVGSGKSSLLDAMVLALYNSPARDLGKTSKNNELANLSSADFRISFEFETGSGSEKKVYRFTTTNKRKRNGEMGSFSRQAYLQEGTEWRPLDGTDASTVLGIDKENFIKTIIIPQGAFADFLQMTGGARTDMMLKLFPRLQEFDLKERVEHLLSATRSELDNLKGKLQELGDVAEEMPASEWESRLSALTDRIAGARLQLETARLRHLELEEKRKAHAEWSALQIQLQALQSEETARNQQKQALDRFEGLFRLFHSDWVQWKEGKNQEEKERQIRAECAARLQDAETKRNEARSEWEKARSEAEQIPGMEDKHRLLTAWLKRLEIGEKVALTQSARIQKTTEREERKSALDQLSARRKTIQEAWQRGLEEGSEKGALLDQQAWFREWEAWLGKNREWLSRKEQAGKELAARKEQKDQFLRREELAPFRKNWPPDPRLRDLTALLDQARAELDQTRKALQAKQEEWAVRLRLRDLAGDLAEGEPCPVCGSTHHPAPLPAGEIENPALLAEVRALQQQDNFLEMARREVVEMEQLSRISQEKLRDIERECDAHAALEAPLLARKQSLGLLEGSTPETIREKLGELERKKEENQKRKAELEAAQQKEEAWIRELETLESALRQLSEEEFRLKGQLEALPEWENPTASDPLRVRNDMANLEKQIQQARNSLEYWTPRAEASQEAYVRAAEQDRQAQLRLQECSTRNTEREADLLSRIQREGLSGLADLEAALNRPGDPARERQALEAFFQNLATQIQRRNELEQQQAHIPVPAGEWEASREESQAAEAKLGQLESERAVEQDRFDTWKKRMERLALLKQEARQLENRAANIQTIKSLFAGNAFVNYVSSVYLQNIVELANARFFALTRQKLRLVLDAENNFRVRDYLNEGQERSVRTLSGGQIFQASLCLSLALADSIRHLTRSERSFFFLDEGFGSLDKEALALVLDTLRQLRDENRVVGIISHVEELQAEIDQALVVELDPEKGSQIRLKLG